MELIFRGSLLHHSLLTDSKPSLSHKSGRARKEFRGGFFCFVVVYVCLCVGTILMTVVVCAR